MVPERDLLRTRLLRDIHERMLTAHPGRNKTRKLVTAQYWWSGVSGDVDRYVANCLMCHASKVPRDKTPGLLHPLPIADRPWASIACDFKACPRDKYGYDNALVCVDRLSKGTWTMPCQRSATAKEAAKLYYEGPFRVYGLPGEVVTDRGPQFVSDFTDELSRILGIRWKLSTSGHSQTAGQAEIVNQYFD